jgi:hypothetical protein
MLDSCEVVAVWLNGQRFLRRVQELSSHIKRKFQLLRWRNMTTPGALWVSVVKIILAVHGHAEGYPHDHRAARAGFYPGHRGCDPPGLHLNERLERRVIVAPVNGAHWNNSG